MAQKAKKDKYTQLVQEVRAKTGLDADYHTIIISLLHIICCFCLVSFASRRNVYSCSSLFWLFVLWLLFCCCSCFPYSSLYWRTPKWRHTMSLSNIGKCIQMVKISSKDTNNERIFLHQYLSHSGKFQKKTCTFCRLQIQSQEIATSTDQPVICTMIAKSSWIQRSGLPSPFVQDGTTFNSSQKLIGYTRTRLHEKT